MIAWFEGSDLMTITDPVELETLKAIGRIVAQTLESMKAAVRPGMTTLELDELGLRLLREAGAVAAPPSVYGFPGATCISISPVAAHGIPNGRVIQPGDIVNIDVSASLDGIFADNGGSVAIPPVSPGTERLLSTAREALDAAVAAARAGRPVNNIGRAAEKVAHRAGYRIVKALTSHGVGHTLHDDPGSVFNFYRPSERRLLQAGWVLAIEPFLTSGSGDIFEEEDRWTLRTSDHKPVAQFEHTVVVTEGEPLIVTKI